MNFQFSESQAIVVDSVRRFLQEKTTLNAKLDAEQSEPGYDQQVWSEICQLGWLEFAQAGDSEAIHMLGIVAQELGRHSLASPFLACVGGVVQLSRAKALNDDLFAGLCSGNTLLSWAPDANLHRLDWGLAEDGSLVLRSGEVLVEWGGAARYLVLSLKGDGDRYHIASVDLEMPGIARRVVRSSDNTRLAMIEFEKAVITADQVTEVSAVDRREAVGLCNLLGAAEAVGGAEGALQLTIDYVAEREQFGHTIARFQAVRHGLADVKIHNDAAWLAVWCGLGKAAEGQELGGVPELAMMAAKRAFQEAALKGSQYHGGMGHTIDSHMQFFYRRAGTYHGRCPSEWKLLKGLADAYIEPRLVG